MLKMQEQNEKNLKKLERVNLACDELYKLYEDIDYYIKKETKNEVRETFFLDKLLKEEIEKYEILYPNVRINQDINNLQLFTDKRWFSKVIGNIILNSLKYNRDDNDISIYTKDNNLIIEDSGIGMSESELFMIFDRYYQGKNKKDGFGIGLSIVKAFCDENKILIKIESKLGKGTKINLDLDKIVKIC
ncbi:MAG: HAMP domain-containing sensor histidine kinase [Sulfurospirillaceae bacterium]|nr:HAMP domain-containing sensor histidine kinase [Sulfurospirillaceae bacterium]